MSASEPLGSPAGFEVRAHLSRGPWTAVAAATSRRYGDVVLKYSVAPYLGPRGRAAFEREARLHLALSPDAAPHPSIVAFVAASAATERHPWIATRPGGVELADVLRRRQLGRSEAVRLCHDILDALATLHDRRLVHGDLTPRNVLVYNGRAALCDLGLAGEEGRTVASRQLGTPEYMAPELLADPGMAPDCVTDVYAAGRVLGEILDGVDMTKRLERLVYDRAQSHRREDRPRDAADFHRLFARAVQPEHRSRRSKGVRGLGRGRQRWVGAALAATLVFGGGLWLTFLRAKPVGMSAPTDGAHVVSPVATRGTGTIPTTSSIYLVTRTGNEPYVLDTDPATVDSDGRHWSRTLDLGRGPCDEGVSFDIWALLTPDGSELAAVAAESRRRSQSHIEIHELPEELARIGAARVTMTRFQGLRNTCPGVSEDVDSTRVPDSAVP